MTPCISSTPTTSGPITSTNSFQAFRKCPEVLPTGSILGLVGKIE